MPRLSKEQRREQILHTAQKVFAEKGYAGTSIKELAKTADMSPALIYTYFDSKEALYHEVMRPTRESVDPVLEVMKEMGAGPEALVYCVYDAVYGCLIIKPSLQEKRETFTRLLFQSVMDGTEFSKQHHRSLEASLTNEFVAECFRVAEDENSMLKLSESYMIRMQLLIHVIAYLQIANLPGNELYDYHMGKNELLEDTVLFCLRGIGFTSEAIGKYYRPEKLRSIADKLHHMNE